MNTPDTLITVEVTLIDHSSGRLKQSPFHCLADTLEDAVDSLTELLGPDALAGASIVVRRRD